MDKINERCAICGEPIDDDDNKVFCPDCGAPMHEDCYELAGKCPNSDNHIPRSVPIPEKPKPASGHLFPEGNGCEICGKPFSDTDEKVFCPDCGASMHRLCYDLTHSCPYEDEHGKEPLNADVPKPAKQSDEPVCDICGKKLDNGETLVYCPVCGTPMHSSCWEASPVCPNKDRHTFGYDWEADHKPKKEKKEPRPPLTDAEMRRITFDNFPQIIKDHPMRSDDDGEELTCFGVRQEELLHFLGTNNFSTPRFFTLFMNMANSGKVFSLNLSAWFFAPFYHFYRRMTGPAIILTLITFVLMIPTVILELMYWRNAGGEQIINDPLANAATITSYIMMILRVAILIFSDYIYMRWSVSKIMSIRERYKDADADEYYAALEHYGNPRMLYVLGGVSLLMFLVYLLNVFISAAGIIS